MCPCQRSPLFPLLPVSVSVHLCISLFHDHSTISLIFFPPRHPPLLITSFFPSDEAWSSSLSLALQCLLSLSFSLSLPPPPSAPPSVHLSAPFILKSLFLIYVGSVSGECINRSQRLGPVLAPHHTHLCEVLLVSPPLPLPPHIRAKLPAEDEGEEQRRGGTILFLDI